MSKERSPFFPGKPVPPEFFVGREEQVRVLQRAIRQASAGSPQYVFIRGERGIGKSSLAAFARELAEKEFGFVGAHAFLGAAGSLGEVCRKLYEALVAQLPEKTLIEKAKQVFQRYVDGIDLFGFGIRFKDDPASRESLAENFLPLLEEANRSFSDTGRKGIILIADDLNGISGEARFGHFLKSTVDQMAVGPMRNFPWILILVGVPERMDDLKAQQPSVDRIFQVVDLLALDRKAAETFFRKSFDSVDHKGQPGAFRLMSEVAGGSPVIWHELGDAVFWADDDLVITAADVAAGLQVAAENVGRKYLKGPLYDQLRSEVYKNILGYIASSAGPVIERSEAIKALPEKEAKNLDNFIRKMRGLDVIRPGATQGTYAFTNLLYFYYIVLQGGQRGGVGRSGEAPQPTPEEPS